MSPLYSKICFTKNLLHASPHIVHKAYLTTCYLQFVWDLQNRNNYYNSLKNTTPFKGSLLSPYIREREKDRDGESWLTDKKQVPIIMVIIIFWFYCFCFVLLQTTTPLSMNPLDNAGNLDFFGQRPWRQGFQGMYCNKCITPKVLNDKIIKFLFVPKKVNSCLPHM